MTRPDSEPAINLQQTDVPTPEPKAKKISGIMEKIFSEVSLNLVRPKHIIPGEFSGNHANGAGAGFSPPVGGGDGPDGEGGGRDGSGGSGKKPPSFPGTLIEGDDKAEEDTTAYADVNPESFSRLEERIPEAVIRWIYNKDRVDTAPKAVEIGTEDSRLKLWAQDPKNNLIYVEPTGYAAIHEEFVRKKFFNHLTRRNKIEQVRQELDEHIVYLRGFQVGMRTAMPRAQQQKHENTTLQESFASQVQQTFDSFKGSMPKSSRLLIADELDEIEKMTIQIKAGYSRELEQKIVRAAKVLEGILRYRMEAREGTYRSTNLTPKSIVHLLGLEKPEELFLSAGEAEDLIRICDFGSGDGETMILLAAELSKVMDSIISQRAYQMVQEVCKARYGQDKISKIQHGLVREIEKEVISSFKAWKDMIMSQVKDKFLCIDQAPSFIERLHKKGVGGVVADLCLPSDEFLDKTGIEPGSVRLGISSLTIDRVRDVDQFIRNVSISLEPGAQFILLTKSSHSAKSDAASASYDPFSQIVYANSSELKTKNRFQLLEILRTKFMQHGLVMERVGRHPGRVISSDVSGNSVQNYKLLAIVCRKMTAPAQTEEAPDKADE